MLVPIGTLMLVSKANCMHEFVNDSALVTITKTILTNYQLLLACVKHADYSVMFNFNLGQAQTNQGKSRKYSSCPV